MRLSSQDSRFGKGYKALKSKLAFDTALDQKASPYQSSYSSSEIKPSTVASDPPILRQVDMSKVKMEIMKPWITQRVTELMGIEDELVINFVFAQLEPEEGRADDVIDPKDMQINLMGFMERKAAPFMGELWSLLVSAAKSSNGIPPEFLEKKKAEIRHKKAASCHNNPKSLHGPRNHVPT